MGLMRTHTIEGERMLSRIGGVLGEAGEVVRSHHEHWDGRGYPDGLSGDGIPTASRVIACCDAFNAMTTDRPYRDAMPVGRGGGRAARERRDPVRPRGGRRRDRGRHRPGRRPRRARSRARRGRIRTRTGCSRRRTRPPRCATRSPLACSQGNGTQGDRRARRGGDRAIGRALALRQRSRTARRTRRATAAPTTASPTPGAPPTSTPSAPRSAPTPPCSRTSSTGACR